MSKCQIVGNLTPRLNYVVFIFECDLSIKGLTIWNCTVFKPLKRGLIIHQFRLQISTVVPAKSDSDVMFCLQSYQGLIIDRSLVYQSYPQIRINTQVIYRFAYAQVKCTRLCFT